LNGRTVAQTRDSVRLIDYLYDDRPRMRLGSRTMHPIQ
jgi:hypothetical protein